jgi:hypothetical protein
MCCVRILRKLTSLELGPARMSPLCSLFALVALLATLRTTDCNQFAPHLRNGAPWFEGWYTRITSANASIGFIFGGASAKYFCLTTSREPLGRIPCFNFYISPVLIIADYPSQTLTDPSQYVHSFPRVRPHFLSLCSVVLFYCANETTSFRIMFLYLLHSCTVTQLYSFRLEIPGLSKL